MTLAIETSGDILSVACGLPYLKDSIKMLNIIQRESHSTYIGTLTTALLDISGISPRQINKVAVSGGPGSFTGLRIGFAFTFGFCYALKIPLVVVPTDFSFACRFFSKFNFIVVILKGKGKRYFCSIFNSNARKIKSFTKSKHNLDKLLQQFVPISSYVGIIGPDLKNFFISYPSKWHVRFIKVPWSAKNVLIASSNFQPIPPEYLYKASPFYWVKPYVPI